MPRFAAAPPDQADRDAGRSRDAWDELGDELRGRGQRRCAAAAPSGASSGSWTRRLAED